MVASLACWRGSLAGRSAMLATEKEDQRRKLTRTVMTASFSKEFAVKLQIFLSMLI